MTEGLRGGMTDFGSIGVGGGFMSDMNVRPPREGERGGEEEGSLALLGMTEGEDGRRERVWGGFALFSFPSPDGLG